jgi:hypothetical protein
MTEPVARLAELKIDASQVSFASMPVITIVQNLLKKLVGAPLPGTAACGPIAPLGTRWVRGFPRCEGLSPMMIQAATTSIT